MVSIIKEHLGHCIKLLPSILTLKGLYLELCIMCFLALHRGAAGFILTLQFRKISKFFLTESEFTESVLHALWTGLRSCRKSKLSTRIKLKKMRIPWKKMRNEPTLRKKFKNLLYTSAKPGLSIEEAILHCLLQIYGIKIVAVAMFMIL